MTSIPAPAASARPARHRASDTAAPRPRIDVAAVLRKHAQPPSSPAESTGKPAPLRRFRASPEAFARAAAIGEPDTITTGVSPANATGTSITATDAGTPDGDCTTTCTVTEGDLVTLTANNSTDWTFASWGPGGQCAGQTATCHFTAVGSEDDPAVYTQNPVVITIGTPANGSVAVDDTTAHTSCSSASCSVGEGDSISITATPNANYNFSSWSGGSCDGATTATCAFMASKDETDSAAFTQIVDTVTLTATGPGTASLSDSPNSADHCLTSTSKTTVTCAVGQGDAITVTATAANSANFTGYSTGLCSTQTNTTPSVCEFTAEAAADIETATFDATTSVTAANSGNGTTTVSDTSPWVNCPGTTASCTVD
ncbi:MAG TPA: hypothetical protein VKS25_09030, partial [Solirubrobacteraceae bacterium]|nr:hypothetical protein [Solirubrobacteraceae bacterium]